MFPKIGRLDRKEVTMPGIEEPVPCEECEEIVELQSTIKCRGCRHLVCRDCIVNTLCTSCQQWDEKHGHGDE